MTVLVCSICRQIVKGSVLVNLPPGAPEGFAERAGMSQAFGQHIHDVHKKEFGAIVGLLAELQTVGSEVAGWLAMGYGVSSDPVWATEREATRQAIIARVEGLKKMLAPMGVETAKVD